MHPQIPAALKALSWIVQYIFRTARWDQVPSGEDLECFCVTFTDQDVVACLISVAYEMDECQYHKGGLKRDLDCVHKECWLLKE